MMDFTDDEIVTLVESLREYRIRVADGSRRLLCEALVFRFGRELEENAKNAFLKGEQELGPFRYGTTASNGDAGDR